MTVSSRMHLLVAAMVFIVAGLAIGDWLLLPEKSTKWMIAIATVLGIWLVVALMGRARSYEEYSVSERKFLMTSIVAGGLILAVSLGRHMANALGFVGGEPLDRAIGVGAGMVLLLLGNTMPKILGPLTAKRCAPAHVQSIQRFAGWVFVLDGLFCIAGSLFLPLDTSINWTMIATATALLLVAARYAWAFLAPSARSSPTSG